MSLYFEDHAEDEYEKILNEYLAVGVELARDFQAEFEHATSQVTAFPKLGSPLRIRRFRFVRLRRFPYLIIYQIVAGDIWIMAVAHYRRRHGYWNKRRINP